MTHFFDLLSLIVICLGGIALGFWQERCEERADEPARKAPATARGPAARRRLPALERDGEPLTPFEERQLGRIEMEALVTVAEPFYAALEDGYERLADAYRRLGPPGSAAR